MGAMAMSARRRHKGGDLRDQLQWRGQQRCRTLIGPMLVKGRNEPIAICLVA